MEAHMSTKERILQKLEKLVDEFLDDNVRDDLIWQDGITFDEVVQQFSTYLEDGLR